MIVAGIMINLLILDLLVVFVILKAVPYLVRDAGVSPRDEGERR